MSTHEKTNPETPAAGTPVGGGIHAEQAIKAPVPTPAAPVPMKPGHATPRAIKGSGM